MLFGGVDKETYTSVAVSQPCTLVRCHVVDLGEVSFACVGDQGLITLFASGHFVGKGAVVNFDFVFVKVSVKVDVEVGRPTV